MSSIGGYLGWEMGIGTSPHQQAVPLNLARHALAYVIRARNYRRLYVPRFTCDVLRGPLEQSGVELEFYGIDELMDPVFDFARIDDGEGFLYTNYFGLKDRTIALLAQKGRGLVIDNAQSFYATPLDGMDTFYSCRKFFGVPDGAYLYSSERLPDVLERDLSFDRCEHLLRSIDRGTEDGYPFFRSNEALLDSVPLRSMSRLTERMMAAIDHDAVTARRRNNSVHLHAELKDRNLLPIDPLAAGVPITYPFLTEDGSLRERLQAHKIYAPRYWPGLLGSVEAGTPEHRFADRIVHLPIDQRYGAGDMDRILEVVRA